MRNTHLFEQFMQENELEFDVPFKIVFKPTIGETDFDTVYIHKDDNTHIGFTLKYADSDEVVKDNRFDIIGLLFADNVKIVKKPWKPKEEEIFYCIDTNGDINMGVFTVYSTVDLSKYITGNCFKTREDAEKHKDDVLKILNGEPFVKWEE